MTYKITHRTIYEYSAPVTVSHHAARVEPRPLAAQVTEDFSLHVAPAPALQKTRTDYFGNQLCLFSIQEVHARLEIVTNSRVALSTEPAVAVETSPAWEEVARLRAP